MPNIKFIAQWKIAIILPGDKYGRNDCLTHPQGAEPMVEFYCDNQFVTRYYASTITERDGGLCCDMSIPEWDISADMMQEIRQFILEAISA